MLKDPISDLDSGRIPKAETHLKVFRCVFCPEQGTLFVGMPEESYKTHIINIHNQKLWIKRQAMMKRECRICEKSFDSDLKLTRHVKKNHFERGIKNEFPFGGFGCKEEDEEVVEVVEVVAASPARRKRPRSTSHSSKEEEVKWWCGREGRVQDGEEEPASEVSEHLIKEEPASEVSKHLMVLGEENRAQHGGGVGPRPIIIDGSNVAMAHGCGEVFSSKGRRKG